MDDRTLRPGSRQRNTVKESALRRTRVLALGLGLALVVVLVDYARYADARGETIRQLRDDASRTWLRDGLMGRSLFGPEAPVLPGRSGDSIRIEPNEEGLLLWVVDPGRCVSCFDELAPGRELGLRSGARTVVVLSGTTAGRVADAAARGGTVALDPAGDMLAWLTDGRMAGVAMYVDPDGVVLAAEGFNDRYACDWSFTGSLGALLGQLDAGRARRNPESVDPSLVSSSYRPSEREDP